MFCVEKKVEHNGIKYVVYKCSCGTLQMVKENEKPNLCNTCTLIYKKLIKPNDILIEKLNHLENMVDTMVKKGVINGGFSKI